MVLSSSSGECGNVLGAFLVASLSELSSLSLVSVSLSPAKLVGSIGVEGGYDGVMGVLTNSGSTRAFQGPWNGFPSMQSVWSVGRRQSQLGNARNLFRRMLMVCKRSSSTRASGRVEIPVESAMRTRRLVNSARKTGRTRRGLDATLSSSRHSQTASTGGKALRKFAEMSKASKERVI